MKAFVSCPAKLLHTLDSVGLFLHVSHVQGAVWVPASPLLTVELPGQLMLWLAGNQSRI